MKKPKIKNAFPELFLAINLWFDANSFTAKDRERIEESLDYMWGHMTGKEIDFMNKKSEPK